LVVYRGLAEHAPSVFIGFDRFQQRHSSRAIKFIPSLTHPFTNSLVRWFIPSIIYILFIILFIIMAIVIAVLGYK